MSNRPGRAASSARGPSQRQLRAGELIRHALVEILARENLRDESLAGVSLTISEVRASPDLRHATAFCTVLGGSLSESGEADVAGAVAALNRAAPHLRHLLGQRLEMKFTPELKFKNDDSFVEARKIDELLARADVSRDLDPGD